ncbi:MAG: zinc ribbon domain-containing protein [Clostridiales bacterium]|jgi:hypothetical protein|nr:zinc ribbon domain-containing protein [Clostridiales bacterium]
MFIIFGFGRLTFKRYGYRDLGPCPRCGQARPAELMKVTTWFTLFFIPVIPYRFEYVLACAGCGYAVKISKVDFEAMTGGASHGSVGSLGEGPKVELSDELKYAGKTPTQIQYLKYMEEREKRNNE